MMDKEQRGNLSTSISIKEIKERERLKNEPGKERNEKKYELSKE